MSYKDMDIEISYTSVGENAFYNVLNPLLSCTKVYKRSVGFFSSSALDFIGDGILDMARQGGHIFLATSPKLSDLDIEAINQGYQKREILEKRFLGEFNEAIQDLKDENAKILCELVEEKILDIKIVRKASGMYHDKLALLEDFQGNTIACVGSNNESGNGYNYNYEKIRVYKSWTDREGRILDETKEFDTIWEKGNCYLDVYDFTEALRGNVIECIKHSNAYSKKTSGYVMRPYQEEAKRNWIDNGHKGFFIMATGTGKTVTALNSIKDFVNEKKIFTVIAVPYKHLVSQWYEDTKKFLPFADIQMVYGEVKNAEASIYSSYKISRTNYKPIVVITTISSFLLDRYKLLYKKIDYEKLLIVDEAHNFFNQISDDLSSTYKYKLGLSATPVFGHDSNKTKELLEWFGGVVIDFPIEKAIGKYLVNYYYHPIYVCATENDEKSFAKATTLMLSAVDQKTNKIIDEERFIAGYRGRLRAISMAEEKTAYINEIFAKIPEIDHTIVYCSDGRLFWDDKTGNEKEIRHLELILKLINNALIDNGQSPRLKASKFTASENVATRMKLIDSFNKGTINYLVAIRCLDEGINIPSIKTALILSSNDNYREFVQRRGRILRLFEDGNYKKEFADIYDIIVCPTKENKVFAEIEFRRFYEYAKLAANRHNLMEMLKKSMDEYGLTFEDISFKNEYIDGGTLYE